MAVYYRVGPVTKNGEFVDMTIAADGHFVKVHQMVMAMASPYLKELITSAPCQHPVIFLNNVNHKTLCSLLEYVYTGEVLLPAENLATFVETARSLHIKGLESLASSEYLPMRMGTNISQLETNELSNILTSSTDNTEQMNLPVTRKIALKACSKSTTPAALKSRLNVPENVPEVTDYAMADDTAHHLSDDDHDFRIQPSANSMLETTPDSEKYSSNLQFTVSIRGSLQIILNRYIYNLHSVTHRTGVRRWRCVDYRNHKCMAYVVSNKNVVVGRGNLHNHPFHDKKILSKIEKNVVYSALDDVEGYKDKEPTADSGKDANAMEHDNEYLSLDFSEENEPCSIIKHE
ncbi:uncharacterized protein LOC125231862 isoform X3 [Leguminivora glycinivorella]|uniref:uncharacterized protein LOC125231862 isoform X3 n=1 Tax=Leguminivora glycinivorella TaxID=1035111 RepID=UPI00200BAC15|nr:uncharacterized protein LOC125231862 isoform X3 [Leguminivora glycinivorella]